MGVATGIAFDHAKNLSGRGNRRGTIFQDQARSREILWFFFFATLSEPSIAGISTGFHPSGDLFSQTGALPLPATTGGPIRPASTLTLTYCVELTG